MDNSDSNTSSAEEQFRSHVEDCKRTFDTVGDLVWITCIGVSYYLWGLSILTFIAGVLGGMIIAAVIGGLAASRLFFEEYTIGGITGGEEPNV